jgi:hypothetical protein
MATVVERFSIQERRPDVLSGTPRAHAIDRWIFVFMAAWFIAITLVGYPVGTVKNCDSGRRLLGGGPARLILTAREWWNLDGSAWGVDGGRLAPTLWVVAGSA